MSASPLISIESLTYPMHPPSVLKDINMEIFKGEALGLLGQNGSGTTCLGDIIAGRIQTATKNRTPSIMKTESISFETQREILSRIRHDDNANYNHGVIDQGETVGEFLQLDVMTSKAGEQLLEGTGLSRLLDRGLRFLSTGEFRRVLLCRALLRMPDLLLISLPFDGLDIHLRERLPTLLNDFLSRGGTMVVITGREEELPEFVNRVVLMREGRIVFDGQKDEALSQYRRFMKELPIQLNLDPVPPPQERKIPASSTPLVEMKGVEVSYASTPILRDIHWKVYPGQHWRIRGPNGSGKSTLLHLVTGDNTKGYGQELYLFGKKKGSGESIWSIKERIGFVSGELHLQHLVDTPLLGIVMSGFYDSIGLYDAPTPVEQQTAKKWCQLMGLEDYLNTRFSNLPFGIQRIALILRSMIKSPPLLIMDEPCHGLDASHTSWVLQCIARGVATLKSTILFVTHNPNHKIPGIDRTLDLVPHPAGGSTIRITRA